MQNVIYKICKKLKGCEWNTESFEVLEAKAYSYNTYEVTARPRNDDIENQLTKDIIYNICSRLQGNYFDTEYFEVLSVKPGKEGEYMIIVKFAENKEGVNDDSNQ